METIELTVQIPKSMGSLINKFIEWGVICDTTLEEFVRASIDARKTKIIWELKDVRTFHRIGNNNRTPRVE